jgi:hypothetical protein
MQSTQEIAELMLDSGRNALLALDIKVSIATLGVGTGALIAGFFGMNVSCRITERTLILMYPVEHPARTSRLCIRSRSRNGQYARYPRLHLGSPNPPQSPPSRLERSSPTFPSDPRHPDASRVRYTHPVKEEQPFNESYTAETRSLGEIVCLWTRTRYTPI